MIVKGRCRGNGVQLAHYLLNDTENSRVEFLGGYGTTSRDPRRALLEMSLTSELSSRTKNGLYHMQLSPRVEEAAEMTWEQKMRAVEITADAMGLAGHKWALFEHEKADGRIHQHLVFERYSHDTGRMWDDELNYDKHKIASRQMEREFGWQFTHENKRHLDKDIKAHIQDMYVESADGRAFVDALQTAGFEVTVGKGRPYQIVDQYGKERDLTRQFEGTLKQKDISAYLDDIRDELRSSADASKDRRQQQTDNQKTTERDRQEPHQSDYQDALSDSQDRAEALKNEFKERDKARHQPVEETLNSHTSDAPPLPFEANKEEIVSEKKPDISDNQDQAAEVLKRFRQRRQEQEDRKRKAREMQQQAAEQTKKQAQERSITDEADEILGRYRERQRGRSDMSPDL